MALKAEYLLFIVFLCISGLWFDWFIFFASGAPVQESRYSTMGRATATSIGNMLLSSRVRSSSNPDITAAQSSEDAEVKNILAEKVLT